MSDGGDAFPCVPRCRRELWAWLLDFFDRIHQMFVDFFLDIYDFEIVLDDVAIDQGYAGDNINILDFRDHPHAENNRYNNNVVHIADERNNPPADPNRQNDDNIGVDAGVGNDIAREAVEEAVDVHQDIPEEEPLPGVSRKRSRELDDEGQEEGYNGLRWYEFPYSDSDSTDSSHVDDPEGINQTEEMLPSGSTKRAREDDVEDEEHSSKKLRLANSDPGAGPRTSCHTEMGSDEPLVDAPQELGIHPAGGSRKRSRDDCEDEEEDLSPRKSRRSSNESTGSSEDKQ